MVRDDWRLQSYLTERIKLIEAELDRYLPDSETLPASLHQSMRYSVFAGGKRIRPVLLLAACEAVGGTACSILVKRTVPSAISLASRIRASPPCFT